MGRGPAAASTWIFLGDAAPRSGGSSGTSTRESGPEPRPRRGLNVDIPWGRGGASPGTSTREKQGQTGTSTRETRARSGRRQPDHRPRPDPPSTCVLDRATVLGQWVLQGARYFKPAHRREGAWISKRAQILADFGDHCAAPGRMSPGPRRRRGCHVDIP